MQHIRELSGSWRDETRQEAEAAGSLVAPPTIIDRSVNVLIGRAPPAFFRATFPASYMVGAEGLTNEFRFHTIRLWEHADRIRSGELGELAPLLVLCEDVPTERTLREERELILGLPVESAVRTELLALALTVGTRYFSRDVLETLFREELEMLKGASIIDEWIEQGVAKGMAEGMARGRAVAARQMLLRLMRRRFGELPASAVTRVESETPEWCEEMAERVMEAKSLEELGL